MLPRSIWLLCLAAVGTTAQSDSSGNDVVEVIGTDSRSFSTVTTNIPTSDFAGSQYTYLTVSGQSTVTSIHSAGNASATGSSTDSQSRVSSTSVTLTQIAGSTPSSNGTATTSSSISTAAAPTNTIPCNNYPELCNRQYSNITEVCSHNSAFALKNNAGSNQMYPIVDQLNDGIRMLQGETHYVNGTIYNCHTTCELLNAGTLQAELDIAAQWLSENPYEVLTFLVVNSDFRAVEDYISAVQGSSITQYLYTPEYVPQHRDQWPTLAEMILRNQRFVLFMDYNANQTSVPYILDEFTHMWETPFSPTNQSFPCTQERPPNLPVDEANNTYMYLANHNLNTAISLGALGLGTDETILIPNTAEIYETNSASEDFGALGAMAMNCSQMWAHPPNFLLVDYYNLGSPNNGSVFEVAARWNNVTYNRPCCGAEVSAAPVIASQRASLGALAAAVLVAVTLSW
ncbi:hypothetical protein K431DRAFT_225726 [Polychaeton citri CBS 116435]|uniref:PLC-like phosphodiesterase n=1 Tax=Polychaeton citri CBS 116435 TaxID=1314669 RepID=A0A9P4Q9Z8_9PEZI|nr:hypothetical protein K431DRAFT_225726 [Polychaeton citri CBS 116435]